MKRRNFLQLSSVLGAAFMPMAHAQSSTEQRNAARFRRVTVLVLRTALPALAQRLSFCMD